MTGNDTKRQRKEHKRHRESLASLLVGGQGTLPTAGKTGARGPGSAPPRGRDPASEVVAPAGRHSSATQSKTFQLTGMMLSSRAAGAPADKAEGGPWAPHEPTQHSHAWGRAPALSTGQPSSRSPRSHPAARQTPCGTLYPGSAATHASCSWSPGAQAAWDTGFRPWGTWGRDGEKAGPRGLLKEERCGPRRVGRAQRTGGAPSRGDGRGVAWEEGLEVSQAGRNEDRRGGRGVPCRKPRGRGGNTRPTI